MCKNFRLKEEIVIKVLIRIFNDSINSKSGAPLPENAPRRGTKDWRKFEELMIECLREIGHEVIEQVEHPSIPDSHDADKKIRVHQTKNTMPSYDLYYMQMFAKDLFTLNNTGWGCEDSGMKECVSYLEDKNDSTAFCQQLSDKLHASGESKCEQPEVTDPTPEKFIFVPIQTPRDYVIKNHSPITMKYFVESIANWAAENNYHTCFKLHPHNKNDLDLHQAVDYAATNSKYVHNINGNIHELIKRSVGVFTINSGVGFESILHGKPVATFGNCAYNRVTFNADIRRIDEARNFLWAWNNDQRVIAYQFAHWYYMRHAYCLNLPNTKERLIAYLKGVL